MSVEEMYSLEIEGIRNTIASYTIDDFILSYTKQLQDLSLESDYSKIQLIIDKLDDWYNDNFERIMNSRFVINKEKHTKARQLLNELRTQLDQYKAG